MAPGAAKRKPVRFGTGGPIGPVLSPIGLGPFAAVGPGTLEELFAWTPLPQKRCRLKAFVSRAGAVCRLAGTYFRPIPKRDL